MFTVSLSIAIVSAPIDSNYNRIIFGKIGTYTIDSDNT